MVWEATVSKVYLDRLKDGSRKLGCKANPFGYFTNIYTTFGRHYSVFQALERRLKKKRNDSFNCLVVGPGLDSYPEWCTKGIEGKLTQTYQPFELANCFLRAKIDDYQIKVVDINPKVLNEMKKTPTLLKVYQAFRNNLTFVIDREDKNKQDRYFNTFFTSHVIDRKNGNLIEVPESVTRKIKTKRENIITNKIPENFYDIIVCTVLLTHYNTEATHEMFSFVPKTLDKLKKSVKVGGYFITSEHLPQSEFKSIEYISNMTGSMYTTSASLLKRIK